MEMFMSLNKQAKTLSSKQIDLVMNYLSSTRNTIRNQLIFLLSIKSGLRAKEISSLTWSMVLDSDGEISDYINITNSASKGSSGGRSIPINKQLKSIFLDFIQYQKLHGFFNVDGNVINTQRSSSTSSQAIVNMFSRWYKDLNLIGCSSHSGRRTFITNCSRKISTVGGSLRDIQYLAGHSSLQTTQRYIEGNTQSKIKVVDLI
jgi:integrase/recombinase XerD